MAYIRCSEEFHDKFKLAAVQARRSMQSIVEELIEQWLNRAMPLEGSTGSENLSGNTSTSVLSVVSKGKTGSEWGHFAEQHELLDYILKNGPGKMAEDISGNLKWFAVAARASHERAQAGDVSSAVERSEATLNRVLEAAAEYRHDRGGTGPTQKGSRRGKKRAV